MKSTRNRSRMLFVCLLLAMSTASAQVAAHAPATSEATSPGPADAGTKPVARVNGAVITQNDVMRMMYTIFPYARQHNGVPKEMEPQMRKGAMDMVIFEELLYQEAQRRKLQIAPEKLAKAEAAFRKQFPTKEVYEQYLKLEAGGSKAAMREKIRRSLLIEKMLKTEVEQKSAVTLAEAKAYYDKNPREFQHPEKISFQTISIIPPDDATAAQIAEAKAKIKDAVRIGRAAKTAREFGLIAEQISEDDWHTRMGDRGMMDVSALPPEVAKAAKGMKVGEVSEAIQLGTAWVVIRLNAHVPAGKTPFTEARKKLQADLSKQKREIVRAALNQNLRKTAKIEVVS